MKGWLVTRFQHLPVDLSPYVSSCGVFRPAVALRCSFEKRRTVHRDSKGLLRYPFGVFIRGLCGSRGWERMTRRWMEGSFLNS